MFFGECLSDHLKPGSFEIFKDILKQYISRNVYTLNLKYFFP